MPQYYSGAGVLARTGWGLVAGVQKITPNSTDPGWGTPRYVYSNVGCAVRLPAGPHGHRVSRISILAAWNVYNGGVDTQGQDYRLLVLRGDLPVDTTPYAAWNTNATDKRFKTSGGNTSTPVNWANQLPQPALLDRFLNLQATNLSTASVAPTGMIELYFQDAGPSVGAGEALTVLFIPVMEYGNGGANPETDNYHQLEVYGFTGPLAMTPVSGGSDFGGSKSLPRYDVRG